MGHELAKQFGNRVYGVERGSKRSMCSLQGVPAMTTFIRIATSILLLVGALAACAQGGAPPVDVCKVVENPNQYDTQVIELRANVVAEPHGYHLVGNDCLHGSVGLVIPEKSANDAKFTRMMQQVMTHHARGQVVIIGFFRAAQSDHQVGTLTIDDVISVTTAD